MNNPSLLRTPHSALRNQRAFTLIELLVVIAIIGLLAGLVVGGAGIATTKMRKARVEAERDALITAIESYHKNKGFYPPDNTNDTVQSPLFYELTGVNAVMGGSPLSLTSFSSAISSETFNPATQVTTLFNIGGFINSSTDPTAIVNFYPNLKANQHEIVIGNGGNFTVLGVGVSGPLQMTNAPGTAGNFLINPWHYNSSHPTNNVDSFDLWMDVNYAGKINRISNWSP